MFEKNGPVEAGEPRGASWRRCELEGGGPGKRRGCLGDNRGEQGKAHARAQILLRWVCPPSLSLLYLSVRPFL